MRFQSEEYSITNVMPTKEGEVQGICISRKALEEWREHYTKRAERYLKTGDKKTTFYYYGMALCLEEILQHFEEEEV